MLASLPVVSLSGFHFGNELAIIELQEDIQYFLNLITFLVSETDSTPIFQSF